MGNLEEITLKSQGLARTLENFLTAYPVGVSKVTNRHFWDIIVHGVQVIYSWIRKKAAASLELQNFNWLERCGKIPWPSGQQNIKWTGLFYNWIMRGNCAGTVWFRLPSLYKWSNLDIWVIGCLSECRDLGLWYCSSGPGLRFQQEKDEWVSCHCECPKPWGACTPNKHNIHPFPINSKKDPIQGVHIPKGGNKNKQKSMV